MKENKRVKGMSLIVSLVLFFLGFVNQWGTFGWLGISIPAFSILTLFFGSLVLWLFVAIDWPSVLCILLLGVAGLPGVTYPAVFAKAFGNDTFVFLLFTFVLTYALEQTGILKHVVAKFVHSRFAQKGAWNFYLAFLGSVLVIASFISPTILFMLVFPIYEEMMHVFGLEKGDRRASVLLIATFATIAIGTAMTPINHVFAVTAMGLSPVAISNMQYMLMGIPAGLVLFVLMCLSLRYVWKVDLTGVSLSKVASLQELPKVTKREKLVLAIFVLVVILWLMPPLTPAMATFLKQAGSAFAPLLGTILLAMITVDGKPLLNIQEAITKGVHWPSLLLVGATLSLGTFLSDKEMGVVGLIQSVLTPLLEGLPAFAILVLFMVWAGLQTNFSSNLVTVNLVTTILVTVASAGSLGLHVAVVASLIGFMASLALMTPPAMPYVALSIGSNWTSSKDTILYGGYLLVASILVAVLVAYPLGILFM